MKSKVTGYLFLGLAALTMSVSAQAQSVPTPAHSASSRGNAVVAIRPVTAAEVTAIVQHSMALDPPAVAAQYDRPWTAHLIGAVRCVNGYCARILADGRVQITNHLNQVVEVSLLPVGLGVIPPATCSGPSAMIYPIGHSVLNGTAPTDFSFTYAWHDNGCGQSL